MKSKYVILDCPALSMELAILVPEILTHDQCVNRAKGQPVAAGFFEVTAEGVRAFGHSESLGLKSRPQDSEIIATSLHLCGLAAKNAQPTPAHS